MRIAIGTDHRGHMIRLKVIEPINRLGHEHVRRVEKIAALERGK